MQDHRHIVDHCGDARRSIKRQRAFSHNVLFNVIDGHKGHAFNDDHDADLDDDENMTIMRDTGNSGKFNIIKLLNWQGGSLDDIY